MKMEKIIIINIFFQYLIRRFSDKLVTIGKNRNYFDLATMVLQKNGFIVPAKI